MKTKIMTDYAIQSLIKGGRSFWEDHTTFPGSERKHAIELLKKIRGNKDGNKWRLVKRKIVIVKVD